MTGRRWRISSFRAIAGETIVSDLGLPTAAYGKDADRGDGFGVLWSRADFPDEARRALGDIAKAFGLKGDGGENQYAPCFALWPIHVPAGCIAARLWDAGADVIGRPHTLRIDAVFVAGADAVGATGLLRPDVWPDGEWTEKCSVTLPGQDLQVADGITSAWKGKSPPKVLRAFHKWYTSGFDIDLDRAGEVVRCRKPNVRKTGGSETSVVESRGGGGSTGGVRPRGSSTMTQAISMIGMLVLGGLLGLGWHTVQMTNMQRRHEATLANVASERDAARAQADQSEQRQSRLEQQVRGLQQEVADARDARRADESFVQVAGDFGIGNAVELRQALEQVRGRLPPDKSPERRLPKLMNDMESVIQDLKRTWGATQRGAPQPDPAAVQ
jgi:hypothetical protein